MNRSATLPWRLRTHSPIHFLKKKLNQNINEITLIISAIATNTANIPTTTIKYHLDAKCSNPHWLPVPSLSPENKYMKYMTIMLNNVVVTLNTFEAVLKNIPPLLASLSFIFLLPPLLFQYLFCIFEMPDAGIAGPASP